METLGPSKEAELERVLGLTDPIDIPAAARCLLEVKEVMDEAGVLPEEEIISLDDDEIEDDKLDAFADFLDTLDLDD